MLAGPGGRITVERGCPPEIWIRRLLLDVSFLYEEFPQVDPGKRIPGARHLSGYVGFCRAVRCRAACCRTGGACPAVCGGAAWLLRWSSWFWLAGPGLGALPGTESLEQVVGGSPEVGGRDTRDVQHSGPADRRRVDVVEAQSRPRAAAPVVEHLRDSTRPVDLHYRGRGRVIYHRADVNAFRPHLARDDGAKLVVADPAELGALHTEAADADRHVGLRRGDGQHEALLPVRLRYLRGAEERHGLTEGDEPALARRRERRQVGATQAGTRGDSQLLTGHTRPWSQ